MSAQDTARSRVDRDRTRWRSADSALWAGAGVVVGGFALAYLVPGIDHKGDRFEPLWFVVFGVATLWCALLYLGRRRRPEPAENEPTGWSFRGYSTLVLLSLAAIGLFPNGRFAAFAEGGWSPSVSEAVQWASVVALVPFVLVWALSGRTPRRRSPWRGALSFTAGALTLALLTGAAGLATLRPPVEHAIAEPGEPLAVPTQVSRVGWSWALPEGERLQAIHAGSRGPLLDLGDRVLALDGATGEELWSYRRPDVYSLDLWPVAGDELLHVWQTTGFDEWELLVMDTATGRILRSGPLPDHAAEQRDDTQGVWSLRTEAADLQVLLGQEHRHGRLWTAVARSTMSGEELWRVDSLREPGHTCHEGHRALDRGTVVEGTIVLPMVCAPITGPFHPELGADPGWVQKLIAVDLATGEEAWRWERPTEGAHPPSLWSSLERPGAHTDPVFVVNGSVMLDARTGGEVTDFAPPADDFAGDGPPQVHTDRHGSIRVGRFDVDGFTDRTPADYEVEWFDQAGELTDTFRVEGSWKAWYRRDHEQHAIALAHTTLLTPFPGGPRDGGTSVLSLTADGGSVDQDWIEVEDPHEEEDLTEHDLYPMPGSILSRVEREGSVTLHGLVP